ncbi:hypothetical protein ROZALSC1DRAFT_31634 [Rozella allomycis CSF55]|uniref:DDE-1 domain-containing protein n=1 Tax=Rozella allomycis (strain CSF55) TaxID=988480 RepID=A0A075B390_ROZAC|nr:hypothetical protein O9G_005638 [Rozella allomycis CSF55]RKP16432.1 hypothetical protein ROZALSC1DRAFT_31634 [Rozella allomycis CSF55]|eukprot:EPZ37015.1 hypothetical protein O9G_005638 [Rozella allomycis CSF55]
MKEQDSIRNSLDFGYPDHVFLDTQAKGWFDGDIFESWFKKVIEPTIHQCQSNNFFYTFVDGFKPHKENQKFNEMCELTTNRHTVPPNCASFLQPWMKE